MYLMRNENKCKENQGLLLGSDEIHFKVQLHI